jgi:hypothetical protein
MRRTRSALVAELGVEVVGEGASSMWRPEHVLAALDQPGATFRVVHAYPNVLS